MGIQTNVISNHALQASMLSQNAVMKGIKWPRQANKKYKENAKPRCIIFTTCVPKHLGRDICSITSSSTASFFFPSCSYHCWVPGIVFVVPFWRHLVRNILVHSLQNNHVEVSSCSLHMSNILGGTSSFAHSPSIGLRCPCRKCRIHFRWVYGNADRSTGRHW